MVSKIIKKFHFNNIAYFADSLILLERYDQWRLVAFINGGASKTIFEMSKSSIHRLPKFKGGVNKFLTKNAIFNSSLYLYK